MPGFSFGVSYREREEDVRVKEGRATVLTIVMQPAAAPISTSPSPEYSSTSTETGTDLQGSSTGSQEDSTGASLASTESPLFPSDVPLQDDYLSIDEINTFLTRLSQSFVGLAAVETIGRLFQSPSETVLSSL